MLRLASPHNLKSAQNLKIQSRESTGIASILLVCLCSEIISQLGRPSQRHPLSVHTWERTEVIPHQPPGLRPKEVSQRASSENNQLRPWAHPIVSRSNLSAVVGDSQHLWQRTQVRRCSRWVHQRPNHPRWDAHSRRNRPASCLYTNSTKKPRRRGPWYPGRRRTRFLRPAWCLITEGTSQSQCYIRWSSRGTRLQRQSNQAPQGERISKSRLTRHTYSTDCTKTGQSGPS